MGSAPAVSSFKKLEEGDNGRTLFADASHVVDEGTSLSMYLGDLDTPSFGWLRCDAFNN